MKRDKVTTACEECRVKKKKCDGLRPRCEPCKQSRRECHWTNYSGRSETSTRNYVAQLEAKVKLLEQNGNGHSGPSQPQPSNPITPAMTQVTTPLQPEEGSTLDPNNSSCSDQISPLHIVDADGISPRQLKTQTLHKHPAQTVSTLINASLGKPGNSFGTASIGNFITQVVEAIDTETHSPEWVQPFQESAGSRKRSAVQSQDEPPGFGYALPPRKTSDALMQTYWEYIHTIFPFVDRHEMESAYLSLWTVNGATNDEPITLFILNVMFAVSSRLCTSIPPGQRDAAAKTFEDRAHEVYNIDVWSTGNFQSVQAMLLLGLHYHTSDPHQSWMAISIAVRTAQSLGLHLPETSEKLPSARAREFARRIWHACVIMDCIMAQTYGRPPMISQKVAASVPLPLPINESFLSLEALDLLPGSTNTPSTMEAFVQSSKMYELLAEIIAHYYSVRPRNTKETVLDYDFLLAPASGRSILAFDMSLTRWLEALPVHLQVSDAKVWGNVFMRQAVILRQRFLQIRILLLRPTLRKMVTNSESGNEEDLSYKPRKIQHQIILQCAVTCVETAQEAVRTIRAYGPSDISDVGHVSTWMHNILYLYTAATILIIGRICNDIVAHIPETSMAASWNDAITLLERFEAYGRSAQAAVVILQAFHTQMSQRGSKTTGKKYTIKAGWEVTAAQATPSCPTNADDFTFQSSSGVDGQTIQPEFFDFTNFDFEDFSWMNGVPFSV